MREICSSLTDAMPYTTVTIGIPHHAAASLGLMMARCDGDAETPCSHQVASLMLVVLSPLDYALSLPCCNTA